MRRWTFLDTLKLAFTMFQSKQWAKVTLQQAIRNTYLQKDKFSSTEQDDLADMLQSLKQQAASQTKATLAREQLDSRINSTPLLAGSSDRAADNRQTHIVMEGQGGVDKWAGKQSGL